MSAGSEQNGSHVVASRRSRLRRSRCRPGSAPARPAQGRRPSPISPRPSRSPSTVCAACHGADGNSAIAANPNLAGQGAEYISRQLAALQGGHSRESRSCSRWRSRCRADDMVALGIYYSQQKPKNLAAKDPQLVALGADALPRRRCDVRRARVRGLPLAHRRGHSEELPAAVRPVRRLHVCPAQGVQVGRARQRRRRQGCRRPDHGAPSRSA